MVFDPPLLRIGGEIPQFFITLRDALDRADTFVPFSSFHRISTTRFWNARKTMLKRTETPILYGV